MTYIIGSGLSAMAAAVALVRKGCRPTLLDAGVTPEPCAAEAKQKLAAAEPDDWTEGDLAPLKRIGPCAASGIPRKLYFGSDFAFRDADAATAPHLEKATLCRSFAAGGFSNIWGAVIAPLKEKDLADWPITWSELAPHYAAVESLVRDIPEDVSSATTGSPAQLRPSSQAQTLYASLSAHRQSLARQGIRFEYSRLAVRSGDRDGSKGCRYCGLCLYGCPYDCRYTAATTLQSLTRSGRVRYLPGLIVDKLTRSGGITLVQARSYPSGKRHIFEARKVLVAAGLLESTRIALASLELYDRPIEIRHSDIFTLPMLSGHATPGLSREKLHTLCPLVVEIEDEAICAHSVHLQLYGYNDLYYPLLARELGRMARPLAPALRALAVRLFVVFGYLHSSISSRIYVTLGAGDLPALRLEGRRNPEALRVGRSVCLRLLRNHKAFRAIPILFQLQLDLPGGGYHSAGSFPMRGTPQFCETDRLGSLPSLPGVHLVDASVLPSVPASPMALTAMANAHRIASECAVKT